jgi:hypothetical protein
MLQYFSRSSRGGQISLELGKKFQKETWEELIKIMLGIADLIFVGKHREGSLGDRIGSLLLQVPSSGTTRMSFFRCACLVACLRRRSYGCFRCC